MERRNIVFVAGIGVAVAACSSLPSIPIKIEIPAELQSAIDAVKKLAGLRNLLPASVNSLIDRAEQLVAAITGAGSLDSLKSAGGSLVALLGNILPFLPSTGTIGLVVTAIETLLPLMAQSVGLHARMAASRPTGMTVEQAKAVLRS